MTLQNGPYNAREIEDSGAVEIRMAIYDPREQVGAKTGFATYIPSEDRAVAFWDGNTWQGELVDQIPT